MGSDLTPSLGTSMCHQYVSKKTKDKKKRKKEKERKKENPECGASVWSLHKISRRREKGQGVEDGGNKGGYTKINEL